MPSLLIFNSLLHKKDVFLICSPIEMTTNEYVTMRVGRSKRAGSTSSRRVKSSTASSKSRKRSQSSSRTSVRRTSSCSKRQSTRRSSKKSSSKKRSRKALKKKQDLETMYRARTRQAGLQAIRAIVVALQVVTTFVMFAAFLFAIFDTPTSWELWFYVPAHLLQIYLTMLGITLVFLYKKSLRIIFWLSYLAILVGEVLLFAYLLYNFGINHTHFYCEENEDPNECSKFSSFRLVVHVYIVLSFLIMMHSLIIILSMCWRECHDGSMDQLMETKHGQRLIKKHTSRNASVRTEHSVKQYKKAVIKKKKVVPNEDTIHFMTRKSEDFAHQIVAEDGSTRTGIVATSTSEIYTHQPKKCSKTVVRDCKLYMEKGDKVYKIISVPTKITQQSIDCDRQSYLNMGGDVFPDLEGHSGKDSASIKSLKK